MSQSHTLFLHAQQYIPGGVNSPVRAFKGVGGDPIFFARGEGAYLIDVDHKRYIDYVGSWGPLILGHADPAVVNAVQLAAAQGLGFGAPCPIEVEMAKTITELMPNIQMVRMVNSGTEATLSALRLARGYTQRKKILKFNGCYHGHHDSLLVNAGSGVLTLGIPNSPGVLADLTQHTLTAEFNDLEYVHQLFAAYGDDIAAVIVEPVPGNMGCILPRADFLPGLRKVCDQYGSLLIFDEVMTGFRVALGGAQAHYQVIPDLTTLGKVIGGGLPVGAFGGRRDIMQQMAPLGAVYQAGTLSGNPVTLAAGLATLKAIQQPDFYPKLTAATRYLVDGLQQRAQHAGIPLCVHAVGGMFGLFFTDAAEISDLKQALTCDVERFKQFFHGMLQHGIYLAPSAFEAGFVSSAHQAEELDKTLVAAEHVFATLRTSSCLTP